MAPLLAVGLGTLSWLVAVVLMAALLCGGLLLLHACVHWSWPKEVSPSVDSAPTVPADRVADDGPDRARNPARGRWL